MTGTTDSTTGALRDAVAGRIHRWWWSPGLTPAVVAAALGVELAPGPVRVGGRQAQQAVATVAAQPYRLRMRWREDDELELVELLEPDPDPSWQVVLAELGDPDTVLDRGRGPFPGADQRCHLHRGLTVFDGAGLGIQAVWLYPPTTLDEYPKLTGALEPIRRR